MLRPRLIASPVASTQLERIAPASSPPDVVVEADPPSPHPPGDGRGRALRSGRGRKLGRALAMRPRRLLVRVHRWLSFTLLLWLIVVSISGAWLVAHDTVESWLHPARYRHTEGDVGAQAAVDAAIAALPDDATVYGVTLPVNGRGVYQAYGELALEEGALETAEPDYVTAYVDPGTGEVNGVRNEGEGATNWLYRGHMTLWQDHGVLGVFDPVSGWCRSDADGHEPGGVHGVVCDVLPGGEDMVAWFAVGFVVVLLSGFYLWYWPGVRRWATAFAVKRGRGRFAFHLSLHKAIGIVVWLPLLVIAFTGAAFAFPNMARWFDNATPAQRDFDLWVTPERVSDAPFGAERISYDDALHAIEERYPERTVDYLQAPFGEDDGYTAWVTRGFDPWTREGGAGNVYMVVDQYSGEVLDDATPEDGNTFDQLWDDWSFPVHAGDFGGSWTRAAWVMVGLSPLALATTGVVMNLVRRQKRRRRAARPAPPSAATG